MRYSCVSKTGSIWDCPEPSTQLASVCLRSIVQLELPIRPIASLAYTALLLVINGHSSCSPQTEPRAIETLIRTTPHGPEPRVASTIRPPCRETLMRPKRFLPR